MPPMGVQARGCGFSVVRQSWTARRGSSTTILLPLLCGVRLRRVLIGVVRCCEDQAGAWVKKDVLCNVGQEPPNTPSAARYRAHFGLAIGNQIQSRAKPGRRR